MKECCGLPMNTLEVFGIRLYQCLHRSHHPLVFENLQTGEVLQEKYDQHDKEGTLTWDSHYSPELLLVPLALAG